MRRAAAGRLVATATSFPTPDGRARRRGPAAGRGHPGRGAGRPDPPRACSRRSCAPSSTTCAERGDVLALLWASEAGIYGRYGYGVATRGRDGAGPGRAGGAARRRRRGRARCGCSTGPEIPAVLRRPCTTRLALRRAGGIVRPRPWWDLMLGAASPHGARCSRPSTPAAGGDDGFAVGVDDHGPDFGRTPAGRRPARGGRRRRPPGSGGSCSASTWSSTSRPRCGRSTTRWTCCCAHPRDRAVTAVAGRDVAAAGRRPGRARRARLPGRATAPPPPCCSPCTTPCCPTTPGVYRLGDGTAERLGPVRGRCPPSWSATSPRWPWPTWATGRPRPWRRPAGGPCTTRPPRAARRRAVRHRRRPVVRHALHRADASARYRGVPAAASAATSRSTVPPSAQRSASSRSRSGSAGAAGHRVRAVHLHRRVQRDPHHRLHHRQVGRRRGQLAAHRRGHPRVGRGRRSPRAAPPRRRTGRPAWPRSSRRSRARRAARRTGRRAASPSPRRPRPPAPPAPRTWPPPRAAPASPPWPARGPRRSAAPASGRRGRPA